MDYKNIFNQSTTLSDQSKISYIERMNQIVNTYKTIPTIDNVFYDENISNNKKYQFINVLLAWNKINNILNTKDDIFLYKQIQNNMKLFDNKPTEKQIRNNINFDALVKKLDDLIDDKNYKQALLLGFYVLIYPLRSNYGNVVLNNEQNFEDYLVSNKFNHIYNKKLYLYDLKVKTNKEMVIDLPDKLINIIDKSNQSTYLFTNSKNEPMTNRQFSIYANKILKEIFNTDLTLTSLRHIYINSLDLNKLTTQEKLDIAKNMNHSLLMQNTYRINY